MELEHAAFEPGALLAELEQLVSPQAQAKGLALSIRQDGELPLRLVGDVTRLRQVLLNLLSNAVKFTERGQVELVLACEQRSAERALLSCTVRDTGIGIAPEAQSRIFSPFMQADTSTTRRFGGTGLGLSIARRLTELMGGELGLRSEPGQGSEFQVRLSLQLPAAGEAPARRVLVADDDSVSRVALGAMARALGYEVVSVESGEQLCEHLLSAPAFDAVLLDWQMPGLSGLQALARVAQTGLALPPALLISACPAVELQGTPHLELAREVLEKPVRMPELSRALRAALTGADEPADDVELLPGVRVLVVDDSAINLEVAQRILRREGALVSTAADGGQALALLRAQPDAFDAVLMDVQMPVMDGHAATRRIRQELQLFQLPVIALTAGALVSERQRALEAGMTAFATKPLDPRSLGQLVRKQVEAVRAEPLPTRPRADAAEAPTAHAIPGLRWSLLAPALRREPASLYALLEQLLADGEALLREGLEAGDARVHRLRGGAASLGALELAERAGAVERALVAADVAALEAARPQLEAALRTLREVSLPALGALRPARAAS